jgi:hypothetical protein
MPPKTVGKTIGGDGKSRPVFEADYQSAREKRLSDLRSHANIQFNYNGIAQPSHITASLSHSDHNSNHNSFHHDDDDDHSQQQANLFNNTQDVERLYVHAEDTKDKGRILVADITFQPGDIIFREKPLANASWNEYQCHECAEPHSYDKCRKFLGLYGKNSQLAKSMMDIEELLLSYDIIGDLDRARLFIKLIWLWHQCPEAQCWVELQKLTTAGTRHDDYMQCISEFRNKLIVKKSGLIPDSFTSEHLSTLLAVLNNNSHEIEGFGSGIWLYSSLLEHSCQANCNFVTSQDELILVALSEIPIGTSLTIDYNVATYKPQSIRQSNYQSHYGFTCTCNMCTVGYDKPRAFQCPQSIRYFSTFAKANQLNSFSFGQFSPNNSPNHQQLLQNNPPLRYTTDDNGNNITNDVQKYITDFLGSKFVVSDSTSKQTQSQQPIHPISTMYSFNGIQISPSNSPFVTLSTPTTPGRCVNGIVYPVGNGENHTLWKCSGCGYSLTPEEITICLDYESKIQPPPSVSQGESYEDVSELFRSHNYELPTLAQINDCLSYGVLHVSHSAIYWSLYVLALKWTKTATDFCYAVESTALRQKIKANTAKKKGPVGKKGTKGRGANAGMRNLHQITLAVPEDTIDEEQLDKEEFELQKITNFFSTNYQPYQHTIEHYQKLASEQNKQTKAGMNEDQTQVVVVGVGDKNQQVTIPSHIELPLLCEHLWTLIAESATMNLHPLHPELLIIYDYLAQISILKRRSKRSKYIWIYCYELSKIINSQYSKETYKLRRLVTHTPHTIAQLQHHYDSIEELYQKIAFHQEDTATSDILKQFTLTAVDSDSDDDDDDDFTAKLMSAIEGNSGGMNIGGGNEQGDGVRVNGDNGHNGHNNVNEGDSDSDDDIDADDLLLQSTFGKNILKTAKQHQKDEKKVQTMHHEQGLISAPQQQQQQQQQLSTPQTQLAPKMSNSFGFSASALFSPTKPQQPQPNPTTTSSFGSNLKVSNFGSTSFAPTNSLGSAQTTGAFGSTSTTGAFGSAPTTNAFAGGGFGTFGQTGSAFGQSTTTTSTFGQPATTSAFGQPTTGFGSSNFGSTSFGSNNQANDLSPFVPLVAPVFSPGKPSSGANNKQ